MDIHFINELKAKVNNGSICCVFFENNDHPMHDAQPDSLIMCSFGMRSRNLNDVVVLCGFEEAVMHHRVECYHEFKNIQMTNLLMDNPGDTFITNIGRIFVKTNIFEHKMITDVYCEVYETEDYKLNVYKALKRVDPDSQIKPIQPKLPGIDDSKNFNE
mgnify:CR=1 FL=1